MTESSPPPPDPSLPPTPPAPPAPPTYAATPPPPPPAYGQVPPPAPAWGQPQPGGYSPPPAGYAPGMPPAMSESDMKLWGGAAWWGTFIVSFIAPLVIMLTKGNENPFVRKQAVESLNFQLTTLIGYIVSFVLMLVLIGFLTFFAVLIFHLVITIIAAIKTSSGEDYRAPLNIRFVS